MTEPVLRAPANQVHREMGTVGLEEHTQTVKMRLMEKSVIFIAAYK